MGQGIGEVLTFAVGVAISPVPIIAVVLMLEVTQRGWTVVSIKSDWATVF